MAPHAAFVAAVLVVFTERSPLFAMAGWLLAIAVFAIVHPRGSNGTLRIACEAVEIVSALVTTVLIEAAEKLPASGNGAKEGAAGAKARVRFADFSGTAEAVPLLQNSSHRFFRGL